MPEQYLTVAQVAERLGTSDRFPRRLIAERRIAFVKIGTHVRISESALAAYIEASTVPAIRSARLGRSRFGRTA
ncbi:helix-turn-helix domain-containing protein [Kitasatospora cystarginea]|uniref:Helix-turn-helix domain-containing protein n=1 Tax=Kitasatospora cystarginea TaxID=58350 RepID=A0ABP5RJK8_9ACTN|nr:helix-turn-helix domain-containing protein [Kitasatospora aureofaciens]